MMTFESKTSRTEHVEETDDDGVSHGSFEVVQ